MHEPVLTMPLTKAWNEEMDVSPEGGETSLPLTETTRLIYSTLQEMKAANKDVCWHEEMVSDTLTEEEAKRAYDAKRDGPPRTKPTHPTLYFYVYSDEGDEATESDIELTLQAMMRKMPSEGVTDNGWLTEDGDRYYEIEIDFTVLNENFVPDPPMVMAY